MNDSVVFILNFLGMIPLALLLSRATEDIAEHTNSTLGSLINVTLGNAVEVIICVSALRAGELYLIQNTLVGSVLSNMLLVLGSAFFVGGLVFKEQTILKSISEANKDLLIFAIFGLTIPLAFSYSLSSTGDAKRVTEEKFSLLVSLCMLGVYALFMVFATVTHADQFEEVHEPSERLDEERVGPNASHTSIMSDATLEVEREVPPMHFAVPVLVISVLLVAVSSEYLVGSIEGFSESAGLSRAFISVILLPLIGNAVEHMSAVLVAVHDKMPLAVGIAVGSSVQIALFATPFLVVLSWLLPGPRFTLIFSDFNVVAMFISVLVVNATLADSKTNVLEGAVLISCYIVLGGAYCLL